MKRGRPSLEEEFRRDILQVLGGYPYPATISTVKKLLEDRRQKPCGWDTVQKYLQELTDEHLVLRDALPANQGAKPLVVYLGRSRPSARQGQFLGTFSRNEKQVG